MISIIVPIYNGEKHIEKCMNSLINQTYTDIEIVLVDDGSNDNSNTICKEYLQLDARIVLVEKQNGGLVSAVNAGIAKAKGDYIAFLDVDDFMNYDCIEKVAAVIEKFNVDIVVYDYTSIYEQTSIVKTCNMQSGLCKDIDNLKLHHASERMITPSRWTKAIKREIALKNIDSAEDCLFIGEDILFTVKIMQKIESLYYIKEPLVNYNRVGASMSNGYNKNFLIGYLNLHACMSKVEKNEQVVNMVFFSNIKTLVQAAVCTIGKEYLQELKLILNDNAVKKIIKVTEVNTLKDKVLKILFLNKQYKIIKLLCKMNDKGQN